ncbi:uncharacterized protein DUF4055 [Pseudaminobacter salicylatoxidans]|uniref:Uncharacterized protein DUF4055 n=1 Tax=Pseudaminobacter salicylatoxidans TaxID=93369 RepID=A0A316C1U7_PSESE|nr:DUF4055 domain-containing protein [Pseudaminobacter salicylatoxidans]PWJ81504.1 uncharacterized protein DUF4055 [Pseudaminobacter salicylatoxidans]
MADVTNKHPDYADREAEWKQMRDTARGESKVKAEKEEYLPMPSGFRASDHKDKLYESYQKRAQFPDIVNPTVVGLAGTIHRTEAQITLPERMEPIWERATPDGLPLEALHARITAELLTTGRYGLLVGAPAEGAEVPWIAGYTTEALINWSTERDFFVLDESGLVRDGFEWKDEKQYRVLEMKEGAYTATLYKGDKLAAGEEVKPQARGGVALKEIPFVVIGARDLSVTPETPPLIGVARSAVSIYQLSADYRWQLFMTGQETPTFINCDAPETIGAGIAISLKSDSPEVTPDFKYVGPAGKGIEAHKTAIVDEREVAAAAGAKLFDTEASSQESGESRKVRYAAQTASLITIAIAGAKGLEAALRFAGRMMGCSDAEIEDIVVKPNLSFINSRLSSSDLQALVKSWQDHAISYETLYDNLQRGEIASPERDAEAERKLIEDEMDDEPDPIVAGALPPPVPPTDPNAPPAENPGGQNAA